MVQAVEIGMEEHAVDAIVCDGQQQSCDRRAFIVKDKRGLAVEFLYLGFEIGAAGGRGSECSDLPRTNQRRPKIAKSSGSPAFWAPSVISAASSASIDTSASMSPAVAA